MHALTHRIKRHAISFGYAWNGIQWAVQTQPNFKVHFVLSLCALGGAWFFQIHIYELLVIILCITMGLVVETLNTAIEQTLDCVSLDRRDDIMHAKDIAAAAMLVCACGACIIACFIYVPYLRHYLGL